MSKSSGIHAWPAADRPREKLLRAGESALTDSELLAIVLQSGTKGLSAVDLARRVLHKAGSLRGLSGISLKEWKLFKGLGPAKTAQIRAAIEIGRRFQEQSLDNGRAGVGSSRDVARMFMGRMRDLKKEVVKIAFLDGQNRIIAVFEAEQGTVNCAYPIVREIFAAALQCNASALICIHNHPSGDPAPSGEDRHFTRELRQAGAVLGIAVLDHIIIGGNTYYSFADRDDQSMK